MQEPEYINNFQLKKTINFFLNIKKRNIIFQNQNPVRKVLTGQWTAQ